MFFRCLLAQIHSRCCLAVEREEESAVTITWGIFTQERPHNIHPPQHQCAGFAPLNTQLDKRVFAHIYTSLYMYKYTHTAHAHTFCHLFTTRPKPLQTEPRSTCWCVSAMLQRFDCTSKRDPGSNAKRLDFGIYLFFPPVQSNRISWGVRKEHVYSLEKTKKSNSKIKQTVMRRRGLAIAAVLKGINVLLRYRSTFTTESWSMMANPFH